jgi:hypothetical protein
MRFEEATECCRTALSIVLSECIRLGARHFAAVDANCQADSGDREGMYVNNTVYSEALG